MSETNTYTGAVIYAEFSDRRAEEFLDEPLKHDEMRSIAEACAEGMIIDSTQRKLLALFPRPQNALTVGQRALELVEAARRDEAIRRTLSMRAVIGFGEVTVDNGRLFSSWTFRLARLASQLPDNSLGALQEFVDRIGAENMQPTPRAAAVEGLYLISGGEASETRMASAFASVEAGVFSDLKLRVRGVTRSYRPVDCPLLVGRDKTCVVQLSSETSSRVHGRIEYENSKFRYVDQSRNGSFLLTGTGEEIFLQTGEHVVLAGEGVISPGAPVSQQKGEVVRYECRTTRLSLDPEDDGDTKALKTQKKR